LRTISPGNPLFGLRARAEKKCAASPGGTFLSVLQSLTIFNTSATVACDRLTFAASADSKGKLLVVGIRGLQTLAGEPLDIVAFSSAGTTYRAADRFLVHP
jgi:hypothetical protein